MSTSVAPRQVSAAQAFHKAAGSAKDPMLVEKVLTSAEDTSVCEVETLPMEIRSRMAHNDSEANKAEVRSLQQQQDEVSAFGNVLVRFGMVGKLRSL